MFTVLFALGRTAGWIAQWKEMIADPEQKIGRPVCSTLAKSSAITCRLSCVPKKSGCRKHRYELAPVANSRLASSPFVKALDAGR